MVPLVPTICNVGGGRACSACTMLRFPVRARPAMLRFTVQLDQRCCVLRSSLTSDARLLGGGSAIVGRPGICIGPCRRSGARWDEPRTLVPSFDASRHHSSGPPASGRRPQGGTSLAGIPGLPGCVQAACPLLRRSILLNCRIPARLGRLDFGKCMPRCALRCCRD